MEKKRKLEKRRIRTDQIKQPPIRHEKGLSPLVTTLARDLFQRVGNLIIPTFEQWELGFMRDTHPWREILIWESISRAYDAYVAKHPEAANTKEIAATLAGMTAGVIFEKKEDQQKIQEMRSLLGDAWSQRWEPLLKASVEFPKDGARLLEYGDIIDEHDGSLDPCLKGDVDPRRAIADAEIILGKDNQRPDDFFPVIYGRDLIRESPPPPGTRVLMISLDTQNTRTDELNKLLAAVKVIKGRHDYP